MVGPDTGSVTPKSEEIISRRSLILSKLEIMCGLVSIIALEV